MKVKEKQKKGISLIALIITIIVMIVLAGAIIILLNNSGIIGKANKAKTDSDIANIKEYVNTLQAEWELMTETEKTATGKSTFEAYANSKLEEKGYSKAAVGVDGEVYSNLNESAKTAIVAGIKVGDTVTGYTVTEKSYTTTGEENTYDPDTRSETEPIPQTVKANTDVTWKYMGINEKGEMEIMAMLSEENIVAADKKVTLSGRGGYLKGPKVLNTVCRELYSNNKGTARSMNIDDINKILGYTGEKGSYFDSENNAYIPTPEAMTIGEIIIQKGEPKLSIVNTPDGKDVNTYKADYYRISKTEDVSEMKNPGNIDFIYNSKNTYWIASECVGVAFRFGARFSVRFVDSSFVSACVLFRSYAGSLYGAYVVRPIVSLTSNIQLIYNNTDNVWEIR